MVSRGLCTYHGGGTRCTTSGCLKGAQLGGLCVSHGGGKKCSFADCQSQAKKQGKCFKHGGRIFCTVQNCARVAQIRGRCCRHGGFRRCNVDGCSQKKFSNKLKCLEHLNISVPAKSIPYHQPIEMTMKSILSLSDMTLPPIILSHSSSCSSILLPPLKKKDGILTPLHYSVSMAAEHSSAYMGAFCRHTHCRMFSKNNGYCLAHGAA